MEVNDNVLISYLSLQSLFSVIAFNRIPRLAPGQLLTPEPMKSKSSTVFAVFYCLVHGFSLLLFEGVYKSQGRGTFCPSTSVGKSCPSSRWKEQSLQELSSESIGLQTLGQSMVGKGDEASFAFLEACCLSSLIRSNQQPLLDLLLTLSPAFLPHGLSWKQIHDPSSQGKSSNSKPSVLT